jgi:hypothetical protein
VSVCWLTVGKPGERAGREQSAGLARHGLLTAGGAHAFAPLALLCSMQNSCHAQCVGLSDTVKLAQADE